MSKYDFQTLSSLDFEILVRDLLQAWKKKHFNNFCSGTDSGIDLRHSPSKDKTIIVQCKHYFASGYSKLKSHLINEELPKIRDLRPQEYILTTSVNLTPHRQDELRTIIQSAMNGDVEIIGNETLNNLLGLFPEIEKAHFKLWLSSAAVLDKVLNNEIYRQTEYDLHEIQKKIKLYVHNKSFTEALDLLEHRRVCIISGVPGIGKTTLAEMLLVHYMSLGFTPRKISSDISEAFKVDYRGTKVIFYYDDFLGQTSVYEKMNKNEDDKLLKLIRAVSDDDDRRFILTTREYILNQATLRYERFSRTNFDIIKYVVDLATYTRKKRAHILYNHLHFSDIPRPYIESLVRSKVYRQIVDHKNYNPRIIETMADKFAVELASKDHYPKMFLAALEDPTVIWDHPFDQQIGELSKILLLALLTLAPEIPIDVLENATVALSHDVRGIGFSANFKDALRELDGNFVATRIVQTQTDYVTLIKFHNPSIRDFIRSRALNDTKTISELYDSAIYFEQWETISQLLIALPSFKQVSPQYVVDALARTLGVAVVRIRPENPEIPELKRYRVFEEFLEYRIKNAAIIAAKLNDHFAQAIFDWIIAWYMINVNSRRALCWYGADIISPIKERCGLDNKLRKCIHDTANLIWHELHDASDYYYLTEFISKFPEVSDEVRLIDAKTRFQQFIDSYDASSIAEEDVEQETEYIETAGDYLEIDVSSVLEDLQIEAKSSHDGDYYDDDDSWRGYGSGSSDVISNEDLDSMFSSLLE